MRAAIVVAVGALCAGACSRADAGPPQGDPAAAAASISSAPRASAPHASAPHASAPHASAPLTAPGAASSSPEAPSAAWARRLTPLLFRDLNTHADVTVRLYRDDGTLDDGAAAEVERVLWSAKDGDAPRMSRRLLQLVVKAAARFDAHEVEVVSSHRGKARRGSRHRTGEALDFLFPGVPPKQLADHLRTFARVGVGTYIHPRSQFVHLDVREHSYHWIDGSPPGRAWREHPLPDPTAPARDASYDPSQDLPSGPM